MTHKNSELRSSERGNVALVAMIFLALAGLTVMTLMAAGTFRDGRNLDSSYQKMSEKWKAREEVNKLAAVVARDAPLQLESDVRFARDNCNVNITLPVFDEEFTLAPSSPAIVFRDTIPNCTDASSVTSVFGTFDAWRDARIPVFKNRAVELFVLDGERVKIVELSEVYRRRVGTGTASDTAYAVRFIVEAKNGNYRTRTSGEIILGSSIPGCGTSATLEIAPATVVRGAAVAMTVGYTYANRLQIFNSANVLIHEETVAEQSTRQTFVHNFTPAITETYRVVANGSGDCSARSAPVTVTVTEPPVCPRIAVFSANPNPVNENSDTVGSWNVVDAVRVRLDGQIVAATGSQIFRLTTADRTFTLTAESAAGTCDVSQPLIVRVTSIPPRTCNFPAPEIQRFRANNTSVLPRETVRFDWNIQRFESSGTVRLVHPDGSESLGLGRNDRLDVAMPNTSGDYSYTLITENVCPDGTRLSAQEIIVIAVRICPPPGIDAFTVTPSTVASGGNQMVTFSWSVSGSADSVSISGGVGGGLPASGSVDVLQPTTTTAYTITAERFGCGQDTEQVTVTVNSCPPPTVSNFISNPSSVVIGGSQTVRLSWTLGGTIESVNISGIGIVSGNFVDIPQPQATTTYTITVNGCGQIGQRTATITVITNPQVTFLKRFRYHQPERTATLDFDNCVVVVQGEDSNIFIEYYEDATTIYAVLTDFSPTFFGRSCAITTPAFRIDQIVYLPFSGQHITNIGGFPMTLNYQVPSIGQFYMGGALNKSDVTGSMEITGGTIIFQHLADLKSDYGSNDSRQISVAAPDAYSVEVIP